MTLALLQVAPNSSMLAAEVRQHGFSQPPLLPGMFDSQAFQLVGFFQRYLPASSCPGTGVSHHGQCRSPIGKSRHDGGDAAGMQRPQSGIDGGQCLAAFYRQTSGLQLSLSGMDRDDGPARGANGVAGFSE